MGKRRSEAVSGAVLRMRGMGGLYYKEQAGLDTTGRTWQICGGSPSVCRLGKTDYGSFDRERKVRGSRTVLCGYGRQLSESTGR